MPSIINNETVLDRNDRIPNASRWIASTPRFGLKLHNAFFQRFPSSLLCLELALGSLSPPPLLQLPPLGSLSPPPLFEPQPVALLFREFHILRLLPVPEP